MFQSFEVTGMNIEDKNTVQTERELSLMDRQSGLIRSETE